MKRKQLTETFMMISSWKKLWSPRVIQKYISPLRLKWLNDVGRSQIVEIHGFAPVPVSVFRAGNRIGRCKGPPHTRRCCKVESTSLTLTQRRTNVVCPVCGSPGFSQRNARWYWFSAARRCQTIPLMWIYCRTNVCNMGPMFNRRKVKVSNLLATWKPSMPGPRTHWSRTLCRSKAL